MAQGTDRYDIFVSYATADNQGGWVTLFVDALLAEHPTLTAFFDKRAIRHGGRRAQA
jgi:hypothetical protein